MIRDYVKKPVTVQAIHLDSPEMFHAAHAWITKTSSTEATVAAYDSPNWANSSLVIHTLEGAMTAGPYDYVVRGVQGEFYPCKPDIFALTYREAQES